MVPHTSFWHLRRGLLEICHNELPSTLGVVVRIRPDTRYTFLWFQPANMTDTHAGSLRQLLSPCLFAFLLAFVILPPHISAEDELPAANGAVPTINDALPTTIASSDPLPTSILPGWTLCTDNKAGHFAPTTKPTTVSPSHLTRPSSPAAIQPTTSRSSSPPTA
jgi:hypothetical protein